MPDSTTVAIIWAKGTLRRLMGPAPKRDYVREAALALVDRLRQGELTAASYKSKHRKLRKFIKGPQGGR